jgi:hypothetical protein
LLLVTPGQLGGEAEDQDRKVVLARHPGERAVLDHVDEEAVALRQVAPVAVHEGHLARQRALLLQPQQPGDGRGAPVGAEQAGDPLAEARLRPAATATSSSALSSTGRVIPRE